MTLSDLLPDVLGRVEEALPTDTPPGPTFWNLAGEVYVQMVDSLFEAALITGVVQLSNVQVTLAANTTYFPLQNNVSIGIPKGIIAALRMRAPYAIRKTTLKGLDDYYPNWQNSSPTTQIVSWFPLGCSAFGIYPQLSVKSNVIFDFLYSPVNEPRPYTGNETIPLQDEFSDLVSKYAASLLRLKESGAEAEESDVVYKEYLGAIKDLSAFQTRVDSLTYSGAFGGQTRVNPREVV